jgi:lipopolysaccharide/colanic/teichoic acid biosynthesis glycosyltransferase
LTDVAAECDIGGVHSLLHLTVSFGPSAKRLLDLLVAGALLVVLSPLVVLVAVAIRIDSPGPVFFRCRRDGRRGREFDMLKFRKMDVGATGPALTAPEDARFTRFGRTLAGSKLDELPQIWNVLKGEMSLVGPRPEDPEFVGLQAAEYAEILEAPPGITGLSQLAFAKETEILDPTDRVGDYARRILPQKARLDQLYASSRSMGMDLRILAWTVVTVLLHVDVAVDRRTGSLGRRASRDTTFAGVRVGGLSKG